jgi:hypothetical protein
LLQGIATPRLKPLKIRISSLGFRKARDLNWARKTGSLSFIWRVPKRLLILCGINRSRACILIWSPQPNRASQGLPIASLMLMSRGNV